MRFPDRLVLIAAKKLSILIRAFRLGAGATWPGELVLRLRPNILSGLSGNGRKVLLVAGTNGKTTTAKMIESVLTAANRKVRGNPSGANLENGLVSAMIDDLSWTGTLRSEFFIFETDEAALPLVLRRVRPDILILLNLFRDQLDRYGEVDTIARNWQDAFSSLAETTLTVANADDPYIAFISGQSPGSKRYFGLNDRKYFTVTPEHATDSLYCPDCGYRLTFGGRYYSHLGKYACGSCDFLHPEMELSARDVIPPLPGMYNIYNTLAATLATKAVGIPQSVIRSALEVFRPAFGRMESLNYRGKPVRIVLSKNPTGFNESLRTVLGDKLQGPLLLALNDRIPDGRDVSWIWDVDFELINKPVRPLFVTGDRCFDLAVRLKHAGIPAGLIKVHDSIEDGVGSAVAACGQDETLTVLPTYSAMLDIRKILTGKKIL